jgi:hypothetical protein
MSCSRVSGFRLSGSLVSGSRLSGSRLIALAAGTVACAASLAHAQRTITFDALANNTSVSNQFPGVTFASIFPGLPSNTPRVITLNAATASSARCIEARGDSSGDGSPDFIRMNFSVLQKKVTLATGFRIGLAGPSTSLIRVRSYSSTNALLNTQDVFALEDNCRTFVQVGSDAGVRNIARIEVETVASGGVSNGLYEYLDNIEYELDFTPPVVTITSPTDDACVCQNVSIIGTSCESDGVYLEDSLEYSTTPNGPWTFIASDEVNKCSAQTMYIWNASSVPSGYYYIRFIARNEDELDTTVLRRVFLDRSGPGLAVRSPVTGNIYGGTLCFDGTIENTPCSAPVSTIGWRPAGTSGAFTPVDPGSPTYTISISNDPLGSWNTVPRPDGSYELRVQSADQCGNVSTALRTVTIDNTPPVAIISDPTNCQNVGGVVIVRGTASDANISGWSLQYVGGPINNWTTIASGNSNITNGVLGAFNTSGLPACAYAVRLLVSDRSNLNCSGNTHLSEFVTTIDAAQPGQCDDIDFNNDGLFPDTLDIDTFLRVFAGGACV